MTLRLDNEAGILAKAGANMCTGSCGEACHQHLKGRLGGMRGFKTLTGASVVCRARAFLHNLRSGFYALGWMIAATPLRGVPAQVAAWDVLTADLLTW